MKAQRQYFSFLLRVWEARSNGDQVWRVSLEDPRTGERRTFNSLEALFDYIREQTVERKEAPQHSAEQE